MSTRTIIIILAWCCFFSCKRASQNSKIEKGMIKVAIYYPNEDGKSFDMDYYSTKHMPMAQTLFGEDLVVMSIDKGLTGSTAEQPATYAAIGYFYFNDIPTFEKAMGTHSEKLRADVPNYTDIQPIIQVSEVQTIE